LNLLKNFIINLKLFIMKKLELNQMEGLEGGKFWGWGPITWGECSGGIQIGQQTYYVLWMPVDNGIQTRSC
jgi:hypothetical protein